MKKLLLTLSLSSLTVFQALACPVGDKTRFAPKYDAISNGGMSEVEFNQIISKVQNVYNPIFARQKLALQLISDWRDNTEVTYSLGRKKVKQVRVPGGIARNAFMTQDGLLQVVCHEIGHHLGGFPLLPKDVMSAEGQADYYATSKCMKLVLQSEVSANEEAAYRSELPQAVNNDCASQYKNQNDNNLCLRIAQASQDVARWLNQNELGSDVNFDTKGGAPVKNIFVGHPNNNCRLETYYQGLLCTVNPGVAFNPKDSDAGACVKGSGARPTCWYVQPKPKPQEQSGDRSRNDTGDRGPGGTH